MQPCNIDNECTMNVYLNIAYLSISIYSSLYLSVHWYRLLPIYILLLYIERVYLVYKTNEYITYNTYIYNIDAYI